MSVVDFGGERSESGAPEISPFQRFNRDEWSRLRAGTPMTLDELDVKQLSGINERLSIKEVEDIYLPLSRLLNLHVGASQELYAVTSRFLATDDGKMPFILGLAGSVAVGKSTTARVLQALLARWPNHPRVGLVSTDGFLLPNLELEAKGIMHRKGFPESFDTMRLIKFIADVKAGKPKMEAPVYSHFFYDVIPGQTITIDLPDILIVEGLNVLQPGRVVKDGRAVPFVSDYFDFSIYIDADAKVIENWYLERFKRLRETAFRDPAAYFHRYAKMREDEAVEKAVEIWREINLVNLEENICTTRERADLILHKAANHRVDTVLLRKL